MEYCQLRCVAASDWISLVLFVHVLLLIVVALIKLILPKSPTAVNQTINKEDPKVVDLVEIEDLDKEKISYCRCWRSKKVCLSLIFCCHVHIVKIPFMGTTSLEAAMSFGIFHSNGTQGGDVASTMLQR